MLYWITGNILIDRDNNIKSYTILSQIAKNIKKQNISIWIFPEGTRSHGRGLLPFKTGAFYMALISGLPIVPICVSNVANNKINLNKFSNGLVIIEFLEPIETTKINCNRKNIHALKQYCFDIIKNKFDLLNQEISERERYIK